MGAKLRTTPARSELMKKVRRRGTGPELVVRRALTAIGARYRVNAKGLPGSPDIVNRSRKKALFVHGCFWHYHSGCSRGRIPTRNAGFWEDKLIANRRRDETKIKELEALGFDIAVVWECELLDLKKLEIRLADFWTRPCEVTN